MAGCVDRQGIGGSVTGRESAENGVSDGGEVSKAGLCDRLCGTPSPTPAGDCKVPLSSPPAPWRYLRYRHTPRQVNPIVPVL